jgi:hypothetical protein
MRITSGGNVGIGTTSPGNKLAILSPDEASTPTLGTNAGKFGLFNGTGAGTYGIIMGVINNGNVYQQVQRIDGTATAYNLLLQPSGGNVGIGTTSPVSETGHTSLTINGSSISRLDFMISGVRKGLIYSFDTGFNVSSQGANPLILGTNDTERMRITSGGNLLIGTATDNGVNRLQVTGGLRTTVDNSTSAITVVNTSSSNKMWDISPFNNDLAINESNVGTRMYFQAGGEVIVSGTTDNGAYNLQCNGTGVWGAGAYVNGSDINLKDNITDINNALDLVLKIQPKTFTYKPDYSKDQSIQTGFIAQQLIDVLKDEVYLDGIVKMGNEHYNVAYQNLIPLLVKAIQEQQIQIEQLKNR